MRNKTQHKITLSVAPEFKELAKQLAKEKRRSVTKLFEDWIDEEFKKREEKSEIKPIPFDPILSIPSAKTAPLVKRDALKKSSG